MDIEDRRKKWVSLWTSDIWKNWQLNDRNPDLWKFLPLLSSDDSDKSGLFLIPMCGKSLDMKFLYEEGFQVLGIEFLEDVVKEFFAENDIPCEVKTLSEDFKIYVTKDSKLRIACGDILAFKKEYLGGDLVKMVWDRGAMGSIEKVKKKAYARVIKSLIESPQVKYLLDCWEYQDWYEPGPPHSCPLEMIQDLFGDTLDILELQRKEHKINVVATGTPTADRSVYLMTVRNS